MTTPLVFTLFGADRPGRMRGVPLALDLHEHRTLSDATADALTVRVNLGESLQ